MHQLFLCHTELLLLKFRYFKSNKNSGNFICSQISFALSEDIDITYTSVKNGLVSIKYALETNLIDIFNKRDVLDFFFKQIQFAKRNEIDSFSNILFVNSTDFSAHGI